VYLTNILHWPCVSVKNKNTVQLDKCKCKKFGCVSVNELHVVYTAIDTYMHNIGLFLRAEGLGGGVYVRFDFFGFWCFDHVSNGVPTNSQ
jgi:hypothetical protein